VRKEPKLHPHGTARVILRIGREGEGDEGGEWDGSEERGVDGALEMQG
jgi:hypothetical protein